MSDRPTVLQRFQLFPETSYGGTGNPTRLLRSMNVQLAPQAEVAEMRATGYVPITITTLNREWSALTGDVEPDYNEMAYLYGSCFNSPGTATIAGTGVGGTAYTWTFTPNASSADTAQSYTCEYGDANHANKIPGVQLTGLSMDIARSALTCKFDAIGQIMTAVTLGTAAAFPTSASQPILPSQITTYLDNAASGLGTTRLGRDMHLTWSLANKVSPVWPVDATQTSFAALIPAIPTWEVKLTVGADGGTSGMGGTALYNTLRGGSTVFMRMQGVSPTVIAGTHTYQWTQDVALQVVSAPAPSDMDGLYVFEWTLRPVYDSTWGHFTQVTLKNGIGVY